MMYIQAYRHLYVLAARTMFTDKIDIVSNRLVSYEQCDYSRHQGRDEGTSKNTPEFEYIIGEMECSGAGFGGLFTICSMYALYNSSTRSNHSFLADASKFDCFDMLEKAFISPEIKGFAHVCITKIFELRSLSVFRYLFL